MRRLQLYHGRTGHELFGKLPCSSLQLCFLPQLYAVDVLYFFSAGENPAMKFKHLSPIPRARYRLAPLSTQVGVLRPPGRSVLVVKPYLPRGGVSSCAAQQTQMKLQQSCDSCVGLFPLFNSSAMFGQPPPKLCAWMPRTLTKDTV